MSNPILFFIFIIVIDLILKSVKDKKKIEQKRMNSREIPKADYEINKEKPIRDIMSTLREEVEKERLKELKRRDIKSEKREAINISNSDQVIAQKTFEDKKYWEDKRKLEDDKISQERYTSQQKNNERNTRDDLIRGIIFSEIISEPKSIQNQRKSM